MRTLEDAIAFAARAHEGQTDKAGEPYILHCLRVMQAVSPEARVVAVLHDVVEDTPAFLHRGGVGWREATVPLEPDEYRALKRLTRKSGQPYDLYISWLPPLAREVKIADLRDNLSRPDSLPDSLRKRYEKALRQLEPATKDTP